MAADFENDIAAIARIGAVPTILDVICRTTGMGFAAVARVTEDRWIACAVRDGIALGLEPGGELEVETTLCHEIRQHHKPILINEVARDPCFHEHPTLVRYGFQSYISVPILRADGRFFGTLCAIDPRPARLDSPEVLGMFTLFAELIAFHLDTLDTLEESRADLADEKENAVARERFIAILGHDLRNPLAAIAGGMRLLERESLSQRGADVLGLVGRSVVRMASLIDDVVDFARGRLGGGIALQRSAVGAIGPVLEQVVEELRLSHPDRRIDTEFDLDRPVRCDQARLAQLFSNLLGNALTHGAADAPILARARIAGDMFDFSVSNGGEPIPPDMLEKLFAPFTRRKVGQGHQGLGLGLYIARQIAEAHGGTLTASSDARETRFTFRMPLR